MSLSLAVAAATVKRPQLPLVAEYLPLLPPFDHDDVIPFTRLNFSNLRRTGRAGLKLVCDLLKLGHEATADFPA